MGVVWYVSCLCVARAHVLEERMGLMYLFVFGVVAMGAKQIHVVQSAKPGK